MNHLARWAIILGGLLVFVPYRILKVFLYLAPIQVYYEVVDLWKGMMAVGGLYVFNQGAGRREVTRESRNRKARSPQEADEHEEWLEEKERGALR